MSEQYDRVRITRGEPVQELGSWDLFKVGDLLTARLSCPKCGTVGALSDHVIDSDGLVLPVLSCFHTACEFREFVLLEGWAEAKAEREASR